MNGQEIKDLLAEIALLRGQRSLESERIEKHRLAARALSVKIRNLEDQMPDKRVVNKVMRMTIEPATIGIKSE